MPTIKETAAALGLGLTLSIVGGGGLGLSLAAYRGYDIQADFQSLVIYPEQILAVGQQVVDVFVTNHIIEKSLVLSAVGGTATAFLAPYADALDRRRQRLVSPDSDLT